MIVRPCDDALGFDCSTKLTDDSATKLAAMGCKFAIRYVGVSQNGPADIDAAEIAIVMDRIGALWLVQHARRAGWTPSGQLGQADGTAAARNAKLVGYLPGAVLWQDLEGVSPLALPQAVIDYTNAFGSTLLAAGYAHGLYDGYSAILSPTQLFQNLGTVHSYWSDFATRALPGRGFALKQLCNSITVPAVGFDVDFDMCHADAFGDRPRWMAAT